MGDWVLGRVVAAALLGQPRDDAFALWDSFPSCLSHFSSVFCNQGLALLRHTATVKLQIWGQSVTLKVPNGAVDAGL